MPSVALAALRRLETALTWIAMTGFIVMMLAVLAQVLFRYVLEVSAPWTEELARLLFVQSMLLGMALAVRFNEHIIVDFLFNKLSPEARIWAARLFAVVIICLLLLLMRGAVDLAQRNWNARLVSLPGIRVGYLYVGLVVSFALMAFYTALAQLDPKPPERPLEAGADLPRSTPLDETPSADGSTAGEDRA